MKAVALLLCCVAFAAALSVKSSPEARFAEVDVSAEAEAGTGAKFAATVVSDRDYASLKHEQADKAFAALHLPGSQPDLLAEAAAATEQDEAELAGEANDEELLALAAATESSADEDSEDAETLSAVEQEVDAAEAESDAEDFALIEEADEDEAEDEVEDEAKTRKRPMRSLRMRLRTRPKTRPKRIWLCSKSPMRRLMRTKLRTRLRTRTRPKTSRKTSRRRRSRRTSRSLPWRMRRRRTSHPS